MVIWFVRLLFQTSDSFLLLDDGYQRATGRSLLAAVDAKHVEQGVLQMVLRRLKVGAATPNARVQQWTRVAGGKHDLAAIVSATFTKLVRDGAFQVAAEKLADAQSEEHVNGLQEALQVKQPFLRYVMFRDVNTLLRQRFEDSSYVGSGAADMLSACTEGLRLTPNSLTYMPGCKSSCRPSSWTP